MNTKKIPGAAVTVGPISRRAASNPPVIELRMGSGEEWLLHPTIEPQTFNGQSST